MAKEKEKTKIIEDMTFDSYAYAKDTYDELQKKVDRIKKGVLISAIASGLLLIMIVLGLIDEKHPIPGSETVGLTLAAVGFFGGIVSYFIGGGFKVALRAAKKIAVFGWIILPFPLDLFSGVICFLMSVYMFLFVPIVFNLINYAQVKKNISQAEDYMGYFKPANDAAAENTND